MPPELISVIVPTLNEGKRIETALAALAAARPAEIIVVDGGSTDRTREIAAASQVTVLQTPPGRGRQMNAGAARASGSLLLFVHADTTLPPDYTDLIRQALATSAVAAGAFSLRIDLEGRLIRLVETLANRRAVRGQMPYGDQGLFLRKRDFIMLGGFPGFPLLEDVVMVERIKRFGRIVILPQPAISSGRRWKNHGVLTTSLVNRLIILGYHLGISPDRLARFYYGLGRH